MNRAETEDGSYASARNRKLLAAWAAKAVKTNTLNQP